MSSAIELYRGPQMEFAGKLSLMDVVRLSLEAMFGHRLPGVSLHLTVLNIPCESVATGTPTVRHLMPDFGYCYLKAYVGTAILYQHPHPIDDLVTKMLQLILRTQFPEETEWGFRLDVPGMPPLGTRVTRPVPQVQGAAIVRPYGPDEKPPFEIRRLPESPPPPASLADFDVQPDDVQRQAPVKVVLPQTLVQDLCATRPLSAEVEEGGFLIGKVYQDADAEGCHLAHVLAALNAEYTGASLLQFTFTGDSFAAVKRTLRESRPCERILGWYHTHLFPATDEMGLSSIDLTLHFTTFSIPWQLAGLINLSGDQRTLRFYVRRGDGMQLCPHWGIDERH